MLISDIFDLDLAIKINSLSTDSRIKSKRSMFFCIVGMSFDGHSFVEQAIENGAVCIVHSQVIEYRLPKITYIKVKDVMVALSQAITVFYQLNLQDLKMIGVSGTYGKTTVASWLTEVINSQQACGYIGKLGIKAIGLNSHESFANPEAIKLGESLAKMQKKQLKSCVMEVSSITSELRNNEFIDYQCGIYTNLSPEHIDFHGTFNNYLLAKQRFFNRLSRQSVAIINMDDKYSQKMLENCLAQVVTYGIYQTSSYQAINIELGKNGTSFNLLHQGVEYQVNTNAIGELNVYNLLAVIAAAQQNGIAIKEILKKVNHLPIIPGRMERLNEGQSFEVIIDFAHTVAGFEEVFKYAKKIVKKNSRIISVFGAPGKREIAKRKLLGEIANRYCDLIILTEDDPRNENAADIAVQIAQGIKKTEYYYVENREIAISQAIEIAQKDDIILILAKGEEQFIDRGLGSDLNNYKGDSVVARESLRLMTN